MSDEERHDDAGRSGGPTYYCWHCYAARARSDGLCHRCGHPAAAPPQTTYVDQLLWALKHPLPERRLVAARVLGQRGERRATGPLRSLVAHSDPYLAAEALNALVKVCGRDQVCDLLHERARWGPAPVRAAARAALSTDPR